MGERGAAWGLGRGKKGSGRVGGRASASASVSGSTGASEEVLPKGGRPQPLPTGWHGTWDRMTSRVTGLSTLPFTVLFLPQIFKNVECLAAGNPGALAILPWVGYTTGLLGNLSLLAYFSRKHEGEAVLVQIIGIINTGVLLAQLWISGNMPSPAFLCALGMVCTSAGVNGSFLLGRIADRTFDHFVTFLGIAGLIVVPQAVWLAFFPGSETKVPAAVAALVGAGLIAARDRVGTKLWAKISSWSAILLFASMAVSQLMHNLLHPEAVAGLSVSTTLLIILGNGLMFPRAVFLRDFMWLIGITCGAALQGWGVLLSLFQSGVIHALAFWATTSALALFTLGTIVLDAKASAALRASRLSSAD